MILVTGATGTVGRNVVRQLLDEGVEVRAMSRKPDRADQPDGVEVVGGDLQVRDSLVPALAGVDAAFLFPLHGAMDDFVELAEQSGVERIVLMSADAVNDDDSDDENALAAFHGDNERAVLDSGLEWTVVRPGMFAANALDWAPQIAEDGVVRAPYGDLEATPIHEADIAAVITRALLDDGHDGATYRLSGPESLTLIDQVRLIGEAIGRDLRFEEQDPDEWREKMVARGVPSPVVLSLLRMWADTIGKPAEVLPTVHEVTGSPARTFYQWATDNAAAFGG